MIFQLECKIQTFAKITGLASRNASFFGFKQILRSRSEQPLLLFKSPTAAEYLWLLLTLDT